MGYYSDVAFAIKGKSLARFNEKLENLPEETRRTVLPLFHFADNHLVEENAECWFWRTSSGMTAFQKIFPM